MYPSTIINGSWYSVKIVGLVNCRRIASTSSRDGPSYGRGVWSHGGISRRTAVGAVVVIVRRPGNGGTVERWNASPRMHSTSYQCALVNSSHSSHSFPHWFQAGQDTSSWNCLEHD